MVILWCMLVLLLAAATGSEAQCSGSTSRVEFTVTSVKNGTTHRDVAASLLSEVPADSQDPQPVALKVAHKTQRCGGTEMVAMDISTASSTLAENRQNSTTDSMVTSAPPIPGPEYQQIRGFGFYKRSSVVMTWSQGRRFCESEGAHAVIFRSNRELEEVKKIWGTEIIWTGVYRENPGSEFITVTGSRIGVSMNDLWLSGRPDQNSGDCVAAATSSATPFVYNGACNYPLRVVCFMSS